jgi:hypothetical protein
MATGRKGPPERSKRIDVSGQPEPPSPGGLAGRIGPDAFVVVTTVTGAYGSVGAGKSELWCFGFGLVVVWTYFLWKIVFERPHD